jgi:hypothetical protein
MHHTLTHDAAAPQRSSLADVCGKPAKADLHPHTAAPLLREVAAQALERTSIQKVAADQIGIHRARLSHKLKDGTLNLAQLEAVGPEFCAELGRMLLDTFGPLSTPKARAKQDISEMRRLLDQLDQLLEHVA